MRALLVLALGSLLSPAIGAAALPLPCFLAPWVPDVPPCPQGPTYPGTPLGDLPFVAGHAAAAFRVVATEPDSKVWFYIEVGAWDAPFEAFVWRSGGGGAGLIGFEPGAEVRAEVLGQEFTILRQQLVTPGDDWIGLGWTLAPGNHTFYAAAASAGNLTGRFSLHDERGTYIGAEARGSSELRRLRDFQPAAHVFAGVPLVLGAGVGAAVFASSSVDVEHQLFADFSAFSIPAHAGWWGVERPDGSLRQGPCGMASVVVVSFGVGGCGAYVTDGEPGRWRFFAHVDVGVGVLFPEPMLFLADLPVP